MVGAALGSGSRLEAELAIPRGGECRGGLFPQEKSLWSFLSFAQPAGTRELTISTEALTPLRLQLSRSPFLGGGPAAVAHFSETNWRLPGPCDRQLRRAE